jgi:hypothetical protein
MTKEVPDMKKWREGRKPERNASHPSFRPSLKRCLHPGEADLPKTLGDANKPRAQACSRGSSRSRKVHQRGVKNLPMFRQRGVKTKMRSSAILVVSDHLEFEDQYYFSV